MTAFQRKTLARSLTPLCLPRGGESEASPRGGLEGVASRGGLEGIPPMPKRLPALIKLLTSKTPDIYKPAVAHAVFPSLAAHLWKVRFRYIDNVEHEATLMNVLMAGTGAGKDCISQPINRIMADIRRRDAENLKREAEWKREVNSKGSNKDKRQRPEGLVIQEVDPDMTNPAFVMRMAEADEHFLYTKMNEIDQFDALRGSARGSQQFQIMCLAFDPDNRYGQTRVGTQSVTEKVCIRFLHDTRARDWSRHARLWHLRRPVRRGAAPLYRAAHEGKRGGGLSAGIPAGKEAEGRVRRVFTAEPVEGIREPFVPRQRDSMAEGLCALHLQRLPMVEGNRGFRALVAEIRSVVQDAVLRRGH